MCAQVTSYLVHEQPFESPPLFRAHPYKAVIGQKQLSDVSQEGRLVPNLCLQAKLYHLEAGAKKKTKKKKPRDTETRKPGATGRLYRSSRLPLLGLLSSFTGESASTGEQSAHSLRTRERRAAAFIMSCPDVMRPLYGHYAPHAPGDAAFVGNFSVSFLPLY